MYGREVCDGGKGAGGQNFTVERSVTEERVLGGQNCTVVRSVMEEGVLGARIVQ